MPAPADDPDRVGEILRAIEAFRGGHVVATALCLLPYLFVRPGELRMMRWADVDLDAGEWRFTASKTKTDHVVPLSRQACALLAALRPITGSAPGGWVFPNGRTLQRPLSDAALHAALRRMGIDTRFDVMGWGRNCFA
jgi:integrase